MADETKRDIEAAGKFVPLLSPFSKSEAVCSQESYAAGHGLDVELTNGLGMKFRLIPPGTFQMGSPEEEEARQDDEYQHKVTLTHAFYMGVYPVTQGEWTRVMGNNPSYFSSAGACRLISEPAETSKFPVENVNWHDAQQFLGKLNAEYGMPGFHYRLPTEAEWEYACRAGTTGPFSFGAALNAHQANCNEHYWHGTDPHRPSVVGSYEANSFGLCEMHGNVSEWCQDWYEEDYYRLSPSENPAGPVVGSDLRVTRGGSWDSDIRHCRSAYRSGCPAVNRAWDLGFRVLGSFVR